MSEATVKDRTQVFQSLLVPIDLTPSSDRVLARVARLPLADDARVTILHVVPAGFPLDEQRHAERDANKALAEEVQHLRKRLPKQVSLEALVKVGAAPKVIAASAAAQKADLVVMGRGGGSSLRDSFLGSTAERVVRQSKLPVLVVRLPARAPYARPALAVELEPHAHEVIRYLLRVIPPPRPRVDVVHAFDVPYHGLAYPSLPTYEADARLDEAQARTTRELLKLLGTALTRAGVSEAEAPTWKPHVRYGSPRALVAKTLKKAESDLLVLGTRGHSGPVFVLLGTVAGDLLRAAQCDVLMVPPAPPRK